MVYTEPMKLTGRDFDGPPALHATLQNDELWHRAAVHLLHLPSLSTTLADGAYACGFSAVAGTAPCTWRRLVVAAELAEEPFGYTLSGQSLRLLPPHSATAEAKALRPAKKVMEVHNTVPSYKDGPCHQEPLSPPVVGTTRFHAYPHLEWYKMPIANVTHGSTAPPLNRCRVPQYSTYLTGLMAPKSDLVLVLSDDRTAGAQLPAVPVLQMAVTAEQPRLPGRARPARSPCRAATD